ncbi:MAG TPA: hypothetical protein VIF44_06820, partial [Candidatus Limnocylindrales bacterium]
MDERSGVSSIARVRALIVAAITALTGVAIFAGVTASVAPLIVVFVLVCPGLALVGALRLRDPLFEIVLGVTLSVSIAGLLATMELFLDAWAPLPTLSLLVAISVAGLLLDPALIPRRLSMAAAARSLASASGLRRSLGPGGSSLGEPSTGDAPVSAVALGSSAATVSIVSTASTGSIASTAPIAPVAVSVARSSRPPTVPAMGPMLMTTGTSTAPEPAEGPAAAQPADPPTGGSSADQSGMSAPTSAPASPPAGRGRK